MTDRSNLALEEIGKRAGVSRSTVSRVLNDHPDVRTAVREKVEAVIAPGLGALPGHEVTGFIAGGNTVDSVPSAVECGLSTTCAPARFGEMRDSDHGVRAECRTSRIASAGG